MEAERVAALEGTIRATTAERDGVVARWQAQREIVQRVSALRAAPHTAENEEAITGALRELTGLQGRDPLGRLEVDPEIVAGVVSVWPGVPVVRMLADDSR